MANFRRFRPSDLNKLAKCNLDRYTETYELSFYFQYYAKWPALFQVAEDEEGNIIGYSTSEDAVDNFFTIANLFFATASHGKARVFP